MSRVCVVGLGKLGAVMAAVFADVGHTVVGVDVNPDTVSRVRAGIAPVTETGLQLLIDDNRERLVATGDIFSAVAATDIAFIIVPTPSKANGHFDHTLVLEAAMEIGRAIKNQGNPPYTVVVCSTVMPGSCENSVQPALDAAAGAHVPLVYSPEFIALGSVIADMHNPDFVLVGTNDAAALGPFVEVMSPVVGDDVPFRLLTLVNAEIAKISVNSYVTMKISFTNQLAGICEGIDGADAPAILGTIGHDKRIGTAYLRPGGPYSGPCFPRDNRAFQALAQASGTRAPLAAATDEVNAEVVERIARTLPPEADVTILGLTYKPGTSVQEESLGLKLLEHFPLAHTHDPSTSDLDAQALVDTADYVVVATAWPEYADLDYRDNLIVVDVWGIVAPGPNVARVGVGPPT